MKKHIRKTKQATRTPGEWQLLRWGKEIKGHPNDAGHVIQAHDGIIGVEIARLPVCSETSEYVPCKTTGGRDRSINKRIVNQKESLANAKLLVAAPVLLDEIAEMRCLAIGALLEKMTVEELSDTLKNHAERVLKQYA